LANEYSLRLVSKNPYAPLDDPNDFGMFIEDPGMSQHQMTQKKTATQGIGLGQFLEETEYSQQ
jgi:hypothetical protein